MQEEPSNISKVAQGDGTGNKPCTSVLSRVFNAHIWSAIVAATVHAAVWLPILYWVQKTFLEYQSFVVDYVQFELPPLTRLIVTMGDWVGRHLVLCSIVVLVGILIDVVVLYLLRVRQRPILRQVWFGAGVLLPVCFVVVASWILVSPITRGLSEHVLEANKRSSVANDKFLQIEESNLAGEWKLEYAEQSGQPLSREYIASGRFNYDPRLHNSEFAVGLEGNVLRGRIYRIDLKPPKSLHLNLGSTRSVFLPYDVRHDGKLRVVLPPRDIPVGQSPTRFETQGTDNTLLIFSRDSE